MHSYYRLQNDRGPHASWFQTARRIQLSAVVSSPVPRYIVTALETASRRVTQHEEADRAAVERHAEREAAPHPPRRAAEGAHPADLDEQRDERVAVRDPERHRRRRGLRAQKEREVPA